MHEDRTAVDEHVEIQLLIEQLNVLGSIHCGVGRNEIQTSSAQALHGTPILFLFIYSGGISLWLQHISYENAYPIAT